jgi:hypothetical protein
MVNSKIPICCELVMVIGTIEVIAMRREKTKNLVDLLDPLGRSE